MPNDFLSQIEFSTQFNKRSTLFVGSHELENVKGLVQWEFNLVEERPTGGRGLIAAFGELEGVWSFTFAVVGISALLTNQAFGPFEFFKMLKARLLVREAFLKPKK